MELPELAEELTRLADEDLSVRQRLLETGELFGSYNPEFARNTGWRDDEPAQSTAQ